jgi:hypothetical protein
LKIPAIHDGGPQEQLRGLLLQADQGAVCAARQKYCNKMTDYMPLSCKWSLTARKTCIIYLSIYLCLFLPKGYKKQDKKKKFFLIFLQITEKVKHIEQLTEKRKYRKKYSKGAADYITPD